MKLRSMQSFDNNFCFQFVPWVMLKQVADICSVGETVVHLLPHLCYHANSIQCSVCLHCQCQVRANFKPKAKISFRENLLLRTFVSLYRKFAISNFVTANIERTSLVFREEPNEISFESSLIFRRKFARTKDEFRRITFASFLHNTVAYESNLSHLNQAKWGKA